MDKHKSISIRVNGEKQPRKNFHQETWKDSYQEQAAALESSLSKDTVQETKESSKENDDNWLHQDTKKKKKIQPIFKLFMIAAASAMVIGITAGFIMLRMFAGIEEVNNPQAGNMAAGTKTTAVPSEKKEESVSSSVVLLEGFVLQGGVFSTLAKAEEWQQKFTDKSFSTIVWERGGQYFLFAGVGSTEQTASESADKMVNQGLEIYVKPWQTEGEVKNLLPEESEWLKEFPVLWSKALVQVEQSNGLPALKEEWNSWLSRFPAESSTPVNELKQQAALYLQMLEEKVTNQEQSQIHLLTMWRDMEKLVGN